MELREEWNKILAECQNVYIYGAGKIGRKIYGLIKKGNQLVKLKGFIVSNTGGGYVENKPIISIDKINEKDSTILVSVSDIYQNEILELLQRTGFTNVICAYKYAFLEENDIPQEMPETIMIDLRELLVQQYEETKFKRFDIIVRLLAIRNYYGENNLGFDLYRRMQNFRIHSKYADVAEPRFKALIKSVEEHGYDTDSEIYVDRNLKLIDGSHRIALAIYHNIKKVRVRVLNRFENVSYGLDWFEQYFSAAECNMLVECQRLISLEWFRPIRGIIWPAVSEYASEITELIGHQYEVSDIVDYAFPREIFKHFVYGVYHVDDIAEWKVRAKLEHFGEHEVYHVRMLNIHMPYPDFRVKRVGTTISQKGEKLKKIVRDSYKNKVENYFHDIIFHTSDNYFQSEYMEALTKKAFPLREMFESIRDLEWMLIKSENDYYPKDFPDSYPAYKDIDIICKRNELGEMLKHIIVFYTKYESDVYSMKVIEEEGKGFRVRFELLGFLIFQVDVSCSIEYLKEEFLASSLSRKVRKDGYWISDKRDEVLYRIIEAYKYPSKKRHFCYVRENVGNLDMAYFFANINIQYKEALREFIENNFFNKLN